MTFLFKDLRDMWRAMLEAQRQRGGFHMSFRELGKIWGIVSTNSVAHRLDMLEKEGFVETYTKGKRTLYRAKDENQIRVSPWDSES